MVCLCVGLAGTGRRKNGVNGLLDQFRRFGAARLAAMLAVTLALIGFWPQLLERLG